MAPVTSADVLQAALALGYGWDAASDQCLPHLTNIPVTPGAAPKRVTPIAIVPCTCCQTVLILSARRLGQYHRYGMAYCRNNRRCRTRMEAQRRRERAT